MDGMAVRVGDNNEQDQVLNSRAICIVPFFGGLLNVLLGSYVSEEVASHGHFTIVACPRVRVHVFSGRLGQVVRVFYYRAGRWELVRFSLGDGFSLFWFYHVSVGGRLVPRKLRVSFPFHPTNRFSVCRVAFQYFLTAHRRRNRRNYHCWSFRFCLFHLLFGLEIVVSPFFRHSLSVFSHAGQATISTDSALRANVHPGELPYLRTSHSNQAGPFAWPAKGADVHRPREVASSERVNGGEVGPMTFRAKRTSYVVRDILPVLPSHFSGLNRAYQNVLRFPFLRVFIICVRAERRSVIIQRGSEMYYH